MISSLYLGFALVVAVLGRVEFTRMGLICGP